MSGTALLLERVERRAPWIAALVALTVGLITMRVDPLGVFFDDAIYLLVGKAIATGQGFVYPHLPGLPPAIHYPPVFPLLLAAVWKVAPEFPANTLLFKLVNPVLLACAAAGAVVVGRRLLGLRPVFALLAVAIATVSVPVNALAVFVLSEPLFLALLFPALLVADRALDGEDWRWEVAAALLASALLLTRTIGGVVAIASLLTLAHARRWRSVLRYGVVLVVAALPWQWFVWRHAGEFVPELRGAYGPYLEWLLSGYREGGWPFFKAVAAHNAQGMVVSTGVMVSPILRGGIRMALGLWAFGLVGWGLVIGLRHPRMRVVTLALLGYLALVLVWPYEVDRFLWGIWPWLWLVAAVGALDVPTRVARVARAPWTLVAAAVVVLPFVGHVVYNVRGLSRGWAGSVSRVNSARLIPIALYVSQELHLAGHVVATEGAPFVALHTGVTTVPLERMDAQDYVRPKTLTERAQVLADIDQRFRPSAYVLLPAGPNLAAFQATRFDSSRVFVDASPDDQLVRAFLLSPP